MKNLLKKIVLIIVFPSISFAFSMDYSAYSKEDLIKMAQDEKDAGSRKNLARYAVQTSNVEVVAILLRGATQSYCIDQISALDKKSSATLFISLLKYDSIWLFDPKSGESTAANAVLCDRMRRAIQHLFPTIKLDTFDLKKRTEAIQELAQLISDIR